MIYLDRLLNILTNFVEWAFKKYRSISIISIDQYTFKSIKVWYMWLLIRFLPSQPILGLFSGGVFFNGMVMRLLHRSYCNRLPYKDSVILSQTINWLNFSYKSKPRTRSWCFTIVLGDASNTTGLTLIIFIIFILYHFLCDESFIGIQAITIVDQRFIH